MSRGPLTLSATVLVLANLGPLAGVWFLGWEILPLVLAFWTENVVIGAVNVARILTATGPSSMVRTPLRSAVLFSAHYGLFCLVHGIFVLVIFWTDWFRSPLVVSWTTVAGVLREHLFVWSVAALALSHLFSFLWDFIAHGERGHATIEMLFYQPYGRVIILHLALLLSGFLLLAIGTPVWGLVILVVLKIAFDLHAHVRERAAFAE